MLTPEQIADGWKPHDGGPCPVDGSSRPDLLFRDGEILMEGDGCNARHWDWSHSTSKTACDDIIAYQEEPSDAA